MESIKEIVTSLCAVAAIIIGFCGLRTWRVQLKATADSDLARRILISLYKVKADIAMIRRPMREITLPDEANKFDNEVTNEAFAKQYQEEWNQIAQGMTSLQVACIEAQAVWDRKFPSYLIPLNICVAELQDCIREHVRTRRSKHFDSHYGANEIRKMLYAIGPEDEFTKRVDAVIEEIDSKVRPHFVK